jgi:hypothetical protein
VALVVLKGLSFEIAPIAGSPLMMAAIALFTVAVFSGLRA